MYKIACRILLFDAIALIVLGVYSILFNNTSMFTPIDWIMDPNFWNNEILSRGTQKFKMFTWDYLGMLHIIWGINIFYIVKYGLIKKKEIWALRSLVISVAVWQAVGLIFAFKMGKSTFLLGAIVSAICLFIIPIIVINNGLKIMREGNKK